MRMSDFVVILRRWSGMSCSFVFSYVESFYWFVVNGDFKF